MQFLSIFEPILVYLKLAVIAGTLMALPYMVWQACAFIFPGLKPNEKKAVRIMLGGGSVLALAGVSVAYFGIFPLVLPFLMSWAPEGVEMGLRMNENVNIILKGMLAFAIAFQFPMAVLVMVYLDLLSPETLKRYRRVAIVGLAVGAAMFTPPDPVTMVLMLLPLVLLYEGSILLSYIVVRKRKKTQQEGAAS
jgi:sec-independent protein translocase protein TatC